MTQIRIIPDYDCSPLWSVEDADYIEAESLPLSEETLNRLKQWQATYDAILDLEEPYNTGFASPEAEESFEQEGFVLAQLIQQELGSDYKIYYRDRLAPRLVTVKVPLSVTVKEKKPPLGNANFQKRHQKGVSS